MIDASSFSPITEFERFRFMRGDNGELAEIPSGNSSERLFLVLDCDRYRLARLHIFESDPSSESRTPERFEKEMMAIGRLGHRQLNPIITFGQDDTELYYADPVIDGESIANYLARTGPLPPALALRITLQVAAPLTRGTVLPRAIENFSPGNLFLRTGVTGEIEVVFSDYSGWDRDELSDGYELVRKTSLTLYSLLAGHLYDEAPFILFNSEAEAAPDSLREFVKIALGKKAEIEPFKTIGAFLRGAEALVETLQEPEQIPAPRLFLRDWLLDGDDAVEIGPDFRPLKSNGRRGKAVTPPSHYAFDAEPSQSVSFNGLRFQIFPNEHSIPREGWLEQHRCALRHPGRGLSNQMRVNALVPQGRTLLIGEERIEGLDLVEIVVQHGALEIRHALELGNKLSSALDSIEKTVGACPIWWLPPSNVHFITGSGKLSALKESLNRYGTRAWHHLPVRLQLHQSAQALLEGLDLPESLLKRMRSGSKHGEPARRSAVLLPILGFAITGERFSWDRPLRPTEGVPAEIIELLEETRKALIDNPTQDRGRLLDRIASSLAGEPIPAFMFAELDSPVQSENAIVDSSLSGHEAVGAFQRSRPVGAKIAGLMDRTGQDSFPLIEDESEKREDDATQPIPPGFDAYAQADDKNIESLGLVDDDSIWEFGEEFQAPPATANESEESAVDEIEKKEPIGEVAQSTESLESNSEVTREDQENTAAEEQTVEPPAENEDRPRRELENSAILRPPDYDARQAENGFGEQLLAKSGSNAEPTAESPPQLSWFQVVSIAFLLAGAIFGATWLYGEFSSWTNRQALSDETFRPTHYPEMKTMRLESSAAKTTPPGSQPAGDLETLTRSANSGHAPHQRELGLILSKLPQEMTAAARWFRKAADGGDTEAMFHYGECLVFGRGVPRDPQLAVNTYLSAAGEAGDGRALELLGVCFTKGDGVAADPVRAHDFFRRAVEAGNTEAYYNLAVRYAKGHGTARNEPEAARLFQKGAERGDAACMYAYGRCLETGFGVPRNPALATKWIRKSAALDFEDARAWCGLNGVLVKTGN